MNCCEHLRKAIDSQQPIKQVEWTLEQKTGTAGGRWMERQVFLWIPNECYDKSVIWTVLHYECVLVATFYL